MKFLGTYTKPFYAISIEPNETHEIIFSTARITPISLLDYQQGQPLSEQAISTLLNTVDRELR
ncbi:hypothetical protein EI42_03309 [Thermosporothrix hazakensis]|jgi:hypothetical protein|uniref:Uncharacterized protein n=2 Tax=Thermosporothrix TaxID=768650 RepID=A0A326U6C2_THEHA|nr:hypothetical protein EI42_03309 [Thermosporothrix hazakensis]BBH86859.1 hypothetical protein KTC_16100 [Thermosporothrix sp. COM3]GCE51155.1 hypothetical protein KTH_60240 [Thermosporothrix hazakensis]